MSWTIGNKYLTEAQMQGNALEVYTMLMEYPLYQRTLFIIQNTK